YLCHQMARDLKAGAPAALAKLEELRKAILQAGRARMVEVGASATQAAIVGDVDKLVRDIPPMSKPPTAAVAAATSLWSRVEERDPAAKKLKGPRFVGFVDPATSSGVFLNLARATSYVDTADERVLDYLASNLYTGHGAHSIFMKTWAAGLAYSNGLHPRVATGVLDYYAERCPLLPQTLRFVIDQLRHAK